MLPLCIWSELPNVIPNSRGSSIGPVSPSPPTMAVAPEVLDFASGVRAQACEGRRLLQHHWHQPWPYCTSDGLPTYSGSTPAKGES